MSKKYKGSKLALVINRVFFGIFIAYIVFVVVGAGITTVVLGKQLVSDYRGTATQVGVEVVDCRTRGSGVRSPKWGECYVYARYNGHVQYVTMRSQDVAQYTPGSHYTMYQFGGGAVTTDGHVPSDIIVRLVYEGSIFLLIPAVYVLMKLKGNKAKTKKQST